MKTIDISCWGMRWFSSIKNIFCKKPNLSKFITKKMQKKAKIIFWLFRRFSFLPDFRGARSLNLGAIGQIKAKIHSSDDSLIIRLIKLIFSETKIQNNCCFERWNEKFAKISNWSPYPKWHQNYNLVKLKILEQKNIFLTYD